MQTFLPYQDFSKSAAALDDKRLNNQINEALIILRTLTGWYAKNGGKGWPNHPCTKQWAGNESFLVDYCFACIDEYKKRHGKGFSILQRQDAVIRALEANEKMLYNWEYDLYKQEKHPEWITKDFCAQHRRILLEKDFAFYSGKFDATKESVV